MFCTRPYIYGATTPVGLTVAEWVRFSFLRPTKNSMSWTSGLEKAYHCWCRQAKLHGLYLPYRVWRSKNPVLAAVNANFLLIFIRASEDHIPRRPLHKWPLLKSAPACMANTGIACRLDGIAWYCGGNNPARCQRTRFGFLSDTLVYLLSARTEVLHWYDTTTLFTADVSAYVYVCAVWRMDLLDHCGKWLLLFVSGHARPTQLQLFLVCVCLLTDRSSNSYVRNSLQTFTKSCMLLGNVVGSTSGVSEEKWKNCPILVVCKFRFW